MTANDPLNIHRFIAAQDAGYPSAFERALAELTLGKKRTHWMWFIFPQVAGLGTSFSSRHFAIHSLSQAMCYIDHHMLGPRLGACCAALLANDESNPENILGEIDALKLQSSMTLFSKAAAPGSLYHRVLRKFYHYKECVRTLELLEEIRP